ncbi:hypothetical protein MKW92_021487, partial [Papaver armeniacum]
MSLEFIIFQVNKLTGVIPTSVGNLRNLIQILLFENQLTGSLPTGLGNLTQLVLLSLG